MTDDQRQAFSNLVGGLWTPERKSLVAATLGTMWTDFQSEPEYERLRQAFSDAMRGKRS